jgi:histone-lysine N-methyltransferase SETMAR
MSQNLGGKMMDPVGCYQGTLTGLKEAVCHKRPGLLSQGVLLLNNNAWPLIARTTVNLLNTWHWEILPYSPYSPDLAPSDFHLFPRLKKHLRGLCFWTDDVQEEVKWWLHLQDASFYHQHFESLIYCYGKCLNRYGNYIDKLTAYVPVSKPCVTYCNLWGNIYECMCYNHCQGNAVKGSWALWDNIYDHVRSLLHTCTSIQHSTGISYLAFID